MKTKIFITFLILIIAGLGYLLLTDTDLIPGTVEIGISNEDDQEENLSETENVIEEEEEEEVIVDDVIDEPIDDEEPSEDFTPLEVTDDYLGSTFENNVYGYTVDFPENWYWERLEADQIPTYSIDYLWLDPHIGFAVGEYGGMVHITVLDSTLTKELNLSDDYIIKNTTAAGVQATRVEYDVTGGMWSADLAIRVYIKQNGLLYEIGMHPDSHDEELFQRILNSFTFIE